jgi:hypothetical protein
MSKIFLSSASRCHACIAKLARSDLPQLFPTNLAAAANLVAVTKLVTTASTQRLHGHLDHSRFQGV